MTQPTYDSDFSPDSALREPLKIAILKSFELDEADRIALLVMLYRNPNEEQAKNVPKYKVAAIKYLRVRFNLSLHEAKNLMNQIELNLYPSDTF